MPRVSVIIPSFNHEKYIAKAIQSVLDQTYQDFEIVITDDGSTDGTVNEIKKFSDSRIRLFTLEENQGTAVALNNCISKAKGEYIAVLNSDDVFLPNKLEKQIKFLDEHSDVWAVFGYAQIIDEDGNDFTDTTHFYYNIFKQPNRTRFEWLNYFFYKWNCLCHPSVLARRDCYTTIGPSDPRYAQTGDFYRWIRVCLEHEIYIIPENLIKFRVRAEESNVSGNRPEGSIRAYFEGAQVLKNFLEIKTRDEFLQIFPEASKYDEQIEKDMIPFFIARLALDSEISMHHYFAINLLFDLLGNKNTAEKIEKKYGFRYIDFIKLTGKHDIFKTRAEQKLAEAEQKLAGSETHIQGLLNSWSWKITAPLRKIYDIVIKKAANE